MAPLRGPCWSTAALGGGGAILPLDLEALGEHLLRCRASTGRGFALRCGAERLNGFVATRFITTLLLVLTLLGGTAWLVL
jgi:hypothetical protein